MYMRHIHNFVEVDHAAQPAGVELAGVAVDIVGAGIARAELEMRATELQRTGRDKIAQRGNAFLEGRLDLLLFTGSLVPGRWLPGRVAGFFLRQMPLLLQLPLQMGLRRGALALGHDIGRQIIEILELLAGSGVGVIGIVVQLDQFLGVQRQALDAALQQAGQYGLHAVAQLGFGVLQIGFVNHHMLLLFY